MIKSCISIYAGLWFLRVVTVPRAFGDGGDDVAQVRVIVCVSAWWKQAHLV